MRATVKIMEVSIEGKMSFRHANRDPLCISTMSQSTVAPNEDTRGAEEREVGDSDER